jgi:predicted metal-dependent peptidase
MDDPFFNPDGEGCELYFETGSRAELERLLKLFILTEPEIEAHEDEEVRLYAAILDLSGREGAKLLRRFEFRGGGGTDFRPAIAEAAKWRPDLLMYLTDLEGDAGDEPAFPVLWAVLEGKANAPWGKMVELS